MRRVSLARNIPIDVESGELGPVVNAEWWKKHVRYFTFNRQGIDIFCASFVNSKARANVIFVTGWNESFLKYGELIKTLFDAGFSVFTYDHQSQGLSGRWLMDEQATWVYSFDDYVLDFVFFVNMIEASEKPVETKSFKEPKTGDTPTKKPRSGSLTPPQLPIYCVSHSMGGLITGTAMARNPNLVRRACFSAPAFRFKCGIKALDYKNPLPLPIAYLITWLGCYAGCGQMPLLGFFRADPADPVSTQLSSDNEQLELQRQLNIKHPGIISCCGTFDWSLHCFDAQEIFAKLHSSVRTNSLIFKAADSASDVFVHNSAMDMFAAAAPACKVFDVPGAKHEVLLEGPKARQAVYATIIDYFNQDSDSITGVTAKKPLRLRDPKAALAAGWPDLAWRSVGVLIAAAGVITGVTLMIKGGRR